VRRSTLQLDELNNSGLSVETLAANLRDNATRLIPRLNG
jgi:hypothetical protein